MYNFGMRIKLYAWHYADKIMSWLVRKIEAVPPRTWKALCEQNWYFSVRKDAQEKLGVKILYDEETEKLVSKITRQVIK